MCAQKCRKARRFLRKLRLKYKAKVLHGLAMKVAKKVAKQFCYLHCYRDWPKYRELLKNACFRILRATADHPLPTRAGGQRSEELYSKLKFLIKYLGQSRRECWVFYRREQLIPYPFSPTERRGLYPHPSSPFSKGEGLIHINYGVIQKWT